MLDICVKNGGNHFLVEIASREFMDNLMSILKSPSGINGDVKIEILDLIQTWASVFEGQLQLGYTSTIYKELKTEGINADFDICSKTSYKRTYILYRI